MDPVWYTVIGVVASLVVAYFAAKPTFTKIVKLGFLLSKFGKELFGSMMTDSEGGVKITAAEVEKIKEIWDEILDAWHGRS